MKQYVVTTVLKPVVMVYEAEMKTKQNRYHNILVFSVYDGPAICDLIEFGGKYQNDTYRYYFDKGASVLRITDRRTDEVVMSRKVDDDELSYALRFFQFVELGLKYCDRY